MLESLREAIRKNHRRLLNCGVMLLHNSAPSQVNGVQAAVLECGFQMSHHPPYSLDLAPCDFLFRYLKKHLCGHKFSSDTVSQAFRQLFRVAEWSRSQLLPVQNIITSSKMAQVHRTQGR